MPYTIGLLSWPFAAYWRAYVTTILWAWFVTPAFQVAPLSVHHAAGIGLVISLFSHWSDHDDEDEGWSYVIKGWVKAALFPLGLLGFGWVWHWLQWGV